MVNLPRGEGIGKRCDDVLLADDLAKAARAIFAIERNRSLTGASGFNHMASLTVRTPRTPDRAHLPLLPSSPGGVQHDTAMRGVRSNHSDRVSLPLQVKICMEDSHSGRVRTLGKRVRGNPSRVQISYPPRKFLYYI